MRTPEEHATASAVIRLMRGAVYQEGDEDVWTALHRHAGAIRDHFATLAIDVVVDDTEGYAYLTVRPEEDGETPLPRLVKRRALTYQLSLLLVLLRKRLAEFEQTGVEGKLVLNRDEVVDMLQIFATGASNETRAVDTVDTSLRKAAELGFVRQLSGQPGQWEVRRILKAYVDAQTMADFASRLTEYAADLGAGRD